MAVPDFEVPKLAETAYTDVPKINPGVMGHVKSFVAAKGSQEFLGYPWELGEDWKERAIGRMGEILKKYRSVRVFLDACVHCGACTDKCHYFLGTSDPNNMPVARQELMRKVYRRYFTLPGKIAPWLVGAEDLTKETLDSWFNYYHQCSECRRCSVYCPYGIDTAEITMAGREILNFVGYGQKYSSEILAKVQKIGNNLGLPGPALEDTLEGLEEDILDETGVPVKMPLNVKGAEILLITPSADFFSEPHVESLIGYAKVFHAAGASWTLSSYASEAGNFGLFNGNYETMRNVAMRIRDRNRLGRRRPVRSAAPEPVGHALQAADAHLRIHLGFDPEGRTQVRQIEERR